MYSVFFSDMSSANIFSQSVACLSSSSQDLIEQFEKFLMTYSLSFFPFTGYAFSVNSKNSAPSPKSR